ncbi:hypothetical protein [Paracidovorax citrulli]|uniref:hypothetical protein n=1 Tax=Paracidovorax citrulli TaxID=80869 RepID=UPI001F0F7CD3|nr:hypothetical protein [Paracidovorax citrulli]
MRVALLSRRSAVNQFLVDLLNRGGIQAILQVSIAAFRMQARRHPPDAVILEDCGGTLAEDLGLIRSCISTHVPVLVAGSELQAGFGTALACGAVDYINLSRVGHDELKAEHVKVVVASIKQPEAAYSMRSPRHWRCRRAQG